MTWRDHNAHELLQAQFEGTIASLSLIDCDVDTLLGLEGLLTSDGKVLGRPKAKRQFWATKEVLVLLRSERLRNIEAATIYRRLMSGVRGWC